MAHHPDPADARHDAAFDRLRSADPAADLTPDRASLDAAVRSRLADDPTAPAAPGAAAAAAAAARRDDLSAARAARRPSRWAAVAAVAASTLAVGSLGYALGTATGADGDLTAGTAATAPITLGQNGGAGSEPAPAAESAATDARLTEMSVPADSARILPWFGGRTVFTAQGLSDATGSAQAWSFDPGSVFGADTAARVAASLGLVGEPRTEGGTWVVGALDGRSPSLQLQPDGTASVSYYDPSLDPFGCPVLEPEHAPAPDAGAGADDGGGTSGSAPAPDVPACTPPDLGPAPQGDAAVARAREVVAATGVDPDGFEYEVVESGVPQAVHVSAHAVLGGQRTGLTWSVTLVDDGVQSLYGFLAPLVPLGEYAVVSENAAVERLADPRFGSSGGPVMAAGIAGTVREPAVEPDAPVTSEGPAGAAAAPTGPPAAMAAGAAFAWPVTEVVLTGARLGLAMHTQPDGSAALIPAYELSDASGAAWSVVAVTEEALDFSAGR